MTVEVAVHNLSLVGPYAKPHAVEFSLYANAGHAALPISERAVSRYPLSVRVTVPPGCRIPDWHKYEGEEITLVPLN